MFIFYFYMSNLSIFSYTIPEFSVVSRMIIFLYKNFNSYFSTDDEYFLNFLNNSDMNILYRRIK